MVWILYGGDDVEVRAGGLGEPPALVPGAVINLYTDAGATTPATTPAQIRVVGGGTLSLPVTADSHSQVPPFEALDSVQLWYRVNGGPVNRLYPNPSVRVDQVAAAGAVRAAALRRFWQALAGRAAAPCDVLVMGHSFVEGYTATSWQKTFTALFRDALRSRFPVAGVVGGHGYKTREAIPVPFLDEPTALVGGATVASGSGGYGLGRKRIFFANTSQKVTYTGITCSGFDILYIKTAGSGTLYYKVDAGSAVTFSATGTDADGVVLQVRGLSVGAHTVEIGVTAGVALIDGVMFYDGDETTGIRMWPAGYSASGSNAWVDAANQKWLQSVATVQPALVVLSMVSNDWYGPTDPGTANRQSVTSAQTEANLLSLISALKTAITIDPSFVICTEWPYGTGVSNSAEPFSAYVDAVKRVVAAEPLACHFDLGERITGSGAPAAGHPLVNVDLIHPNNAGMQAWADAFAAFVAPS
jgi:lysophospholipase L1-like esterase